MDQRGIVGIVTLAQLQHEDEQNPAKLLLELVNPRDFPHLHPDHSLSAALDRIGAARLEMLPMVSRANMRQLEGIVTLQDVLRLYGGNT